MGKKTDPKSPGKKVYVVSSEVLEKLLRIADEWDNFNVVGSDYADVPTLTKGRLNQVLEIPTASGFPDFPFKLVPEDGNMKVLSGRVQMPNLFPPVGVDQQVFSGANGTYYWVKMTLNQTVEDGETPMAFDASLGCGASFPTDATAHRLTYTITQAGGTETVTTIPGDGGPVSVELSDVQNPILYVVLGCVNSDGKVQQWHFGDVIMPWAPWTKIQGDASDGY